MKEESFKGLIGGICFRMGMDGIITGINIVTIIIVLTYQRDTLLVIHLFCVIIRATTN